MLARCVSVPRVGYVNTIEGLRDEIEHIEATLDITPIDEVLSQAIILANTDPEVLGDAERTSRNRSEPPPYRTEERLRADAAPASTSRSSTSHNGEATPAEEEVEVAPAARKQGP